MTSIMLQINKRKYQSVPESGDVGESKIGRTTSYGDNTRDNEHNDLDEKYNNYVNDSLNEQNDNSSFNRSWKQIQNWLTLSDLSDDDANKYEITTDMLEFIERDYKILKKKQNQFNQLINTTSENDNYVTETQKTKINMLLCELRTLMSIFKQPKPDGSPSKWSWEQVQKWLFENNLWDMWDIFKDGATDKAGTDGDALLDINKRKLTDPNGDYKAYKKLKDIGIVSDNADKIIKEFLRKLTHLWIDDLQYELDLNVKKELTINDVIEMKRRINEFIEKWDNILWIEEYIEKYDGSKPDVDVICEELRISNTLAEAYWHYHSNIKELKIKDINELLSDFDIYNDAILWWFVIMQILNSRHSKSIWLLINRVAELSPGNVAIALFDKYKDDLTRCDTAKLDEMAQNIVIGSQYPICAALKISKWFQDIADYDVSRGDEFEAISDGFLDVAFDYLNLIQSDHMASIILETKSDIEGKSAIDMALEYRLQKFVSHNRIERIATSIMNDFNFLCPSQLDKAFEIDPLSVDLVFRKLFNQTFYFTPLGTWVCEVALYFGYLA
eukprot:523479_1